MNVTGGITRRRAWLRRLFAVVAGLCVSTSAVAAEVLVREEQGNATYLGFVENLPDGPAKYRIEFSSSIPVFFLLNRGYTFHWDIFVAPPPKPHSEFLEGNNYTLDMQDDFVGTYGSFELIVPETQYLYFDATASFATIYDLEEGTPLYEEIKYENPYIWISADDIDLGRPFDYSIRIFQTVVPEPATWAVMILGFGVAGASLRQAAGRTLSRGSRP